MHTAFKSPKQVASTTDKVESLLLHGRRLYAGSAAGAISIYLLPADNDSDASLQASESPMGKKPIEQLGLVKETNSLVTLSEGSVVLLDLHTLKVQLRLHQTKSQANVFALDSSVQSSYTSRGNTPIPIVVTYLAVACRRKLVLFSWRDSQWCEPKEIGLPHQVRSMTFPAANQLVLGYSDASYGKLLIPAINSKDQLTLSELFTSESLASAAQAATSHANESQKNSLALGLGGLGGLALKTGGYMGLGGIGRVTKNQVLSTGKGEVVIPRDSQSTNRIRVLSCSS